MKLTEDLYNELSQLIEDGEFLRYLEDDKELPTPTDDSDKYTQDFYQQCNATIDLYKCKTDAALAQLEGMKKLLEEKDAVDRANLLIKDFNQKLESEYEDYREQNEEKIKKMREDLVEAKEISAKALKECDEVAQQNTRLKEMYENLQDRNTELQRKLAEKEEQLAHQESGFGDKYVPQEIGGPSSLITVTNQNEKIEKYEQEIRKLKDEIKKSKNETSLAIAMGMIKSGIDYLSNISKVKNEEHANVGEKVLKHIVSDYCETMLGENPTNKLKLIICDISINREKAMEKQEEDKMTAEKNRQESMQALTDSIKGPRTVTVQQGGTYNENVNTQTNCARLADGTDNLLKGGEV